MASRRHPATRVLGLFGMFTVLWADGCGSQTADVRIKAELKRAGRTMDIVFPLAGMVTIDGRPPQGEGTLLVMLYDPSTPKKPLEDRPCVACDEEGRFAFGTYTLDDGVKSGTYVLAFAQLRQRGNHYFGPDELKNLFNDLDKNAEFAEFKIDHKDPDKQDYSFDLKVAGRDAAQPGSNALDKL
jgi:hypothetical protein